MVTRNITTVISLLFSIILMEFWAYEVIVVDSATHVPLPNASIYDKDGTPVGLSNNNGELPKIMRSRYPYLSTHASRGDRYETKKALPKQSFIRCLFKVATCHLKY